MKAAILLAEQQAVFLSHKNSLDKQIANQGFRKIKVSGVSFLLN
jgi:hypothetical protein